MKRKSQLMIVKNCLCLILGLALTTLAPLPSIGAVSDSVHDPHRLPSNDEFQKTIEARCTICHTREQVDAAISAQEDLDALLQRMIERGAILSEKDKSVLGTFWGSPIKQEE